MLRPWGWMVWTCLIHIFSLLRRTDSLRLASASMPCKIMSEMEWWGRLWFGPQECQAYGFLLWICDCIETFFKWVLSLTDILYTTNPARYRINYVRSSTGNVAPDLVVGTNGVTLEGVRLQDMFLTGSTSKPKHSVLDGRNGTVICGRDLRSDKEDPQAGRASESNHRLLRDCTLEAIWGVEDMVVSTGNLTYGG